jgi:hypothetical protein
MSIGLAVKDKRYFRSRACTIAALAIVAFSSCYAQEDPKPKPPPAAELVITGKVVDRSGKPLKEVPLGTTCSLLIELENKSKDTVYVVRGVDAKGQAPDTTNWFAGRYGALRKVDGGYVHNGMQQRLTRLPFAALVVLPGARASHKRKMTVRDKTLSVTVTVQAFPVKWAASNFYFLSPAKKGQQNARYISKSVEDFQKGLPEAKRPVIVSLISIKTTTISVTKSISIPMRPPKFTLVDAIKKAGFKPKTNFYWLKRKGWYLSDSRKAALVTDRVTPMPHISAEAATELSSRMRDKHLWILFPDKGYEKLRPLPPYLNGPGYRNPGQTPILSADADALLELVRKNGDRIALERLNPNGLGFANYLAVQRSDGTRGWKGHKPTYLKKGDRAPRRVRRDIVTQHKTQAK